MAEAFCHQTGCCTPSSGDSTKGVLPQGAMNSVCFAGSSDPMRLRIFLLNCSFY